jgi:phosphoglycerate-specific signal transduction histidine kinase
MNTNQFEIQSIVPSHPDGIIGYVKGTVDDLSGRVNLDINVIRRLKLILTELVTNSIKHSKDTLSFIKITVKLPTIVVQKTDRGCQIQFIKQSLPFNEINKKNQVSFLNESNYQIEILDKYKIKFVDPFKDGFVLDQIPEHLGLYIITLASDHFIYQYDPKSGENSFIASLDCG